MHAADKTLLAVFDAIALITAARRAERAALVPYSGTLLNRGVTQLFRETRKG